MKNCQILRNLRSIRAQVAYTSYSDEFARSSLLIWVGVFHLGSSIKRFDLSSLLLTIGGSLSFQREARKPSCCKDRNLMSNSSKATPTSLCPKLLEVFSNNNKFIYANIHARFLRIYVAIYIYIYICIHCMMLYAEHLAQILLLHPLFSGSDLCWGTFRF